jgi:hypothetical protein
LVARREFRRRQPITPTPTLALTPALALALTLALTLALALPLALTLSPYRVPLGRPNARMCPTSSLIWVPLSRSAKDGMLGGFPTAIVRAIA